MRLGMSGTAIALAVLTAWSAYGQDKPAPNGPSIADAMSARDQRHLAIWYARFEVRHEGPAYLFEMPEAEYGQQFHYRNIEEWWTDGTRCAVAISRESERYLDTELMDSTPPSNEPLYVYVHDGNTVSFIDFQHPGRKLVLNSAWPYENAAIPVFFGRRFGMRDYKDIASKSARIERSEQHLGKACSVMAWTDNRMRVESWLAEELDFLCVREVAYVNDILVVDRAYDFKTSPSGMRYPSDAVERFVTSDGSETIKTWRLLEFTDAPELPFFVFTPSSKDVAVVLDAASGAVLKDATPAEAGAP